jgi:AAA+ ATPase superfamily predicted ATPase
MKKLTLLLKLLFLKSLKHKNKLTRNIENWKVIYESEIKKLGLKPNQLKAIGQSLYIKKLEQVISDSDITEVERLNLKKLSFNLD